MTNFRKQIVTSRYEQSWIVLIPTNGRVLKGDLKIMNKGYGKYAKPYSCIGYNKIVVRHFWKRKDAESELKTLGGFKKEYKGYIISDKQFGDIKIDSKDGTIKLFITKRQKRAVRVVS